MHILTVYMIDVMFETIATHDLLLQFNNKVTSRAGVKGWSALFILLSPYTLANAQNYQCVLIDKDTKQVDTIATDIDKCVISHESVKVDDPCVMTDHAVGTIMIHDWHTKRCDMVQCVQNGYTEQSVILKLGSNVSPQCVWKLWQ